MKRMSAAVAALALLSVVLAGCTSEDEAPIKIVSTPDDPKTGAYEFEATMSADSYSWDFGDGRTATGQTVSHVYGVTNGDFKVKVTATTDGEAVTHEPTTVLIGGGDAANGAPTFSLQMEWDWVQVGEPVILSGAASSDPDDDVLLFSWFCKYNGPMVLAGANHVHGGGGIDFASGNSAIIPVEVVNGTLDVTPSADLGDNMCDALNTGGFTTQNSVVGSFNQSGMYEVSMLAKDPVHPSKPATKIIYVTDTPRQEPQVTHTFSKTIQLGKPQEFDPVLEAAENSEHFEVHPFQVTYPVLGVKASISDDGGNGVPVVVEYQIKKGASSKFGPSADDFVAGKDGLKTGEHTLFVFLRQGSDVTYTVDLEIFYETNPGKVFEAAH